MKKVIAYLRMEEWLSSKVTMMLGILMYFLYLSNSSAKKSLIDVLIYFLFLGTFLAISYIANDYSDIEVDKKAGKKKDIATMEKWQIWLSLIFLFLIGNIPLVLYCENKITVVILVLFNYVMGLAYSTLGIRFKEKGVWGLIECSIAQRCLPLLLIAAMIRLDYVELQLLFGWIIVSFFDGLRYIIIHQVLDLENDLKSGVVTYVSQKKKNYRKIIISLLLMELVGTVALLIPVFMEHIIIAVLLVVLFVVLEFGIYKVISVFANKDWFCTFDSVPLEAFLNCGMPLLLGLCNMSNNRYIFIYVLGLVIICASPMKVKLNIAKIYYFHSKKGE